MRASLTASDVEKELRALGVQAGMALEVHCSLSSFGHIEGGADALIDALIRVVGADGAVVMPSFCLSPELPLAEEDRALGIVTKIRILSEEEERSAMGIVADTFRQRPDVVTGSGTFRVSAWGRDAQAYAASGFGRVIEGGGYALLLGVDIYRLSAMHHVEDVLPDEIRGKFRPSEEARARYPEGQWMIQAWTPEAKPWYVIQEEAYAKGMITDALIGDARCMLFQVKPVVHLYRRALLERPLELYGLR